MLDGQRVLVVEDEALIAMMVEDMLVELGCVVAGTARDAAQALELAHRTSLDAAILDLQLGDGDSYGVAEEFIRRGIPIIFSTGSTASELRPGYETMPFLSKPFETSDLETALQLAVSSPLIQWNANERTRRSAKLNRGR
jgi:CheY-like chemotaxis protein